MSIDNVQQFDEDLRHMEPEKLFGMAQQVAQFLDKIEPGEKVLIAAHPDSDGLVSAAFIRNYFAKKFEGKKGPRIGYTFFELKDERFEERAKNYDHVIVLDLWIDSEEERQSGLRNLLKNGTNVLVIDHHDRDFYAYDEKMHLENYHPLIPETMVFDGDQRTGGNLTFVSPKRLGADIDSSDMTTGIITHRIIRTIEPRSGIDFGILPISVYGDDAQNKWAQMRDFVNGRSIETLSLANTINLSENLIDIRTMVSELARCTANYTEELDSSATIDPLIKLKDWTRKRAADIANLRGENPNQNFLHHHVGEREVRGARAISNFRFRNHPPLYRELGTYLSRRTQIPTITDQVGYINGEPKSVRMSFKYDGDQGVDTRDIAANFQGGGRERASGATIEIPSPQDPAAVQKILQEIEGTLRSIFQ